MNEMCLDFRKIVKIPFQINFYVYVETSSHTCSIYAFSIKIGSRPYISYFVTMETQKS